MICFYKCIVWKKEIFFVIGIVLNIKLIWVSYILIEDLEKVRLIV